MPCHAAIVGRTHGGSAASSFSDLLTLAQENTTNQTADVLVEATTHETWQQERENSTNKREELTKGHFLCVFIT